MSPQQTFEILEVQTREYSRFNTSVTQWKVRLNPPSPARSLPNPVSHFTESANNVFDYEMEDLGDDDMFRITIHNEVNQSDTSIGFSYRQINMDCV